MLWAGVAVVGIALVLSLAGAIWVGIPVFVAGLIVLGVALVRGGRRRETAEPPA
jgi:hypothetical protein